jgi:hypothetical protein
MHHVVRESLLAGFEIRRGRLRELDAAAIGILERGRLLACAKYDKFQRVGDIVRPGGSSLADLEGSEE